MHIWHAPTHQRMHVPIPVLDHLDPFQPFHNDILDITIYGCTKSQYSIWNATIATLKFWTADREPHFIISAFEEVYNAFFHIPSMHLLCHQSEEVLFGHFMTMLNAAFESKLTLEDEG